MGLKAEEPKNCSVMDCPIMEEQRNSSAVMERKNGSATGHHLTSDSLSCGCGEQTTLAHAKA